MDKFVRLNSLLKGIVASAQLTRYVKQVRLGVMKSAYKSA